MNTHIRIFSQVIIKKTLGGKKNFYLDVSVAPDVCRLICPENDIHHNQKVICSKLFPFQAANLGEAAHFSRRTR